MPDQPGAIAGGESGDINRQAVLIGQCGNPFDMIAVFMRYKNGLQGFHGKAQLFHPLFRFPAGNAHIDQNSLTAVSNIITIAVAAGVQGCDK